MLSKVTMKVIWGGGGGEEEVGVSVAAPSKVTVRVFGGEMGVGGGCHLPL